MYTLLRRFSWHPLFALSPMNRPDDQICAAVARGLPHCKSPRPAGAAITQEISGLATDTEYTLTFLKASRPNYAQSQISVKVSSGGSYLVRKRNNPSNQQSPRLVAPCKTLFDISPCFKTFFFYSRQRV